LSPIETLPHLTAVIVLPMLHTHLSLSPKLELDEASIWEQSAKKISSQPVLQRRSSSCFQNFSQFPIPHVLKIETINSFENLIFIYKITLR